MGCEYGCFQLLFYGTGNPLANKKVPFYEVGYCSWGTYWQFTLGRFLIRFLQVIFMKDIIDIDDEKNKYIFCLFTIMITLTKLITEYHTV